MPGFAVTPQSVLSCGSNVGGMTSNVETIKSQASGAEVPEVSWGILGMATTYSSYRELLEKFTSHLDEVGEGLKSCGDKLTECGKAYQQVDEEIAAKLQKIASELGKVA